MRAVVLIGALALLAGCGEPPWNNPHPPMPEGKITYQSMIAPRPPKHLDPARSYASDESLFIQQITERDSESHFRLLIQRHQQHIFDLVTSVLGPRFSHLIDNAPQFHHFYYLHNLQQSSSHSPKE